MKNLIFILMALFAFQIVDAQVVIAPREIPYDVKYHWGIINVGIAKGNVKVQGDGEEFYGTLNGTSIPWEGKILCVSDTLRASMLADNVDLKEHVKYQTGWYRHVNAEEFHSDSYNPANPAIYKNIAGEGEYDASQNSMEAITVTSDMIGMYYYAHVIDFPSLRAGQQIAIPIEGPFSRMLLITYNGEGQYENNGQVYPTYDCSFEYDYGGRLSGYPVECKISKDERIPVYLGASLPVGRVEMLYNPY